MAEPKLTAAIDVRFLIDSAGTLLLGQMGCDMNYDAALADTTMTPAVGGSVAATSIPTITNWNIPVKGYVHTGTGGMGTIFARVGDRTTPITAKVEMGNPATEYYGGTCWLESCKMSGTDIKGAATYDLMFRGTGDLAIENIGA